MENFNWTSFTKKIAVKSDLSTIYDAWTNAGELEKWFLEKVHFYYTDQTPFDRNSNAVGDLLYDWYWYLYEEPMKGKIIHVNEKDLIQFTFEGTCQVDVSLQQKDEYVIITLHHHHIPLDNYSRQFIRLGCSNGWTFYLANLKSVYEGGLDLRNKERKLGTMINN